MSEIDKVAVFERAAQLVETGWCQGTSALDAEGLPARWDSPKAVCFCAMGAIARALQDVSGWTQLKHSEAMTMVMGGLKFAGATTGLVKWNDAQERTRHEVATLLRMVGK